MGFAPGGGAVYVQTEFIYLGYTDVQVSTGPPAVTSISPQYDVQGASGTIHVQGHRLLDDFNYLNAYFRNDTGITASVNLNNASESQADVNYTISSTAAMDAHQLYIQNTWGDSEPTTFKVVYPPATISSLSPGTWTAGQSYHGVQITGTNFGSMPTVMLSDPTIGISAPYNTSSASGTSTTYVDISVPSTAKSEPVTLTLTPGPYTQVSGGPSLSASTSATVVGMQQNSCPGGLDSDGHSGFSSIAYTGPAAGSGSMTISFSRGAFNGYGVTVSYGPYSTPESIASNLAALITKKYASSGLTAQADGVNILYKSTATLGIPTFTTSGLSFMANPSPAGCPPANLKYVLAVSSDTVQWQQTTSNQRGRQVSYQLMQWPNAQNKPFASIRYSDLTPAYPAVIEEHLENSNASSMNGYVSDNTVNSVAVTQGVFEDVLGTGNLTNSVTGTFIADRWFSAVVGGTPVPGSIETFDRAAGTASASANILHPKDHIVVNLPAAGAPLLSGTSILNGATWDVRLQ